MLSVIIITKNEEKNIKRCLASLPKHQALIVVDSGSVDQTVTLAKSFGARVINKEFTNYADQKNRGLAEAETAWVLSIDADEEIDKRLRLSIEEICYGNKICAADAFQIRRSQVFLGKTLRFGKSQSFPVRLFRREKTSFQGVLHEKVDTASLRVARLPGRLIHYSYPSLFDYFVKFNQYTERAYEGKAGWQTTINQLRFWSEFFYRYVFCLGFLDGFAGYSYAMLAGFYHWIKYLKRYESESVKKEALCGR